VFNFAPTFRGYSAVTTPATAEWVVRPPRVLLQDDNYRARDDDRMRAVLLRGKGNFIVAGSLHTKACSRSGALTPLRPIGLRSLHGGNCKPPARHTRKSRARAMFAPIRRAGLRLSGPPVVPLIHRRFRVSYFIQTRQSWTRICVSLLSG